MATAASGVPLAVQRLEAQLPGVALLKRGLAASKALLEGRNPFTNMPWGWGGEDEESIPGANVPAPPPADAQALAEEQRAARYSARWEGDPSTGRSAASGGVSPQWGRAAAAKARPQHAGGGGKAPEWVPRQPAMPPPSHLLGQRPPWLQEAEEQAEALGGEDGDGNEVDWGEPAQEEGDMAEDGEGDIADDTFASVLDGPEEEGDEEQTAEEDTPPPCECVQVGGQRGM